MENKPVPGYEDLYYVNPNTLEVISKRTEKPLKVRMKKNGYPEIHLSRDGKDSYKRIHRLLAELYIYQIRIIYQMLIIEMKTRITTHWII